jgi:hypothetical protein
VNEDGAGDDQAYSLTSVYVPRGKSNLASFVSVGSDATDEESYGRIKVLQLPNEQTSGPGQVANDMTTDESVREELLAFQSGGSKPIYGNLLTLPVGDGLMYVQPVYATRELSDASFPELQFVIVSYGGEVGIGETLREALADVLGVDASAPDPEPQPDPDPNGGGEPDPDPGSKADQIRALLVQAQAAFDAAEAAFREGDTVRWAKKLEEAGELVDRAVAISERRPTAPPAGG